MVCLFCGGPAHPATGSQYTETAISCGPCTRTFWVWVRRHTSSKWGGKHAKGKGPQDARALYFYEHAGQNPPALVAARR